MPEVLLVILSKLPHDDATERRIIDEPVTLDLVDQVLDLRFRRVQAELLHRHGQVLKVNNRFCGGDDVDSFCLHTYLELIDIYLPR